MRPQLVIEKGRVVQGAGLGASRLGYPTLNIEGVFELEYGVYVSRVTLDTGVYRGALHYGPRTTMGHDDVVLEIYLLDFEGEVKDETVFIEVYTRVRDTRIFDSAEALKQEIARDVEMVRQAQIM